MCAAANVCECECERESKRELQRLSSLRINNLNEKEACFHSTLSLFPLKIRHKKGKLLRWKLEGMGAGNMSDLVSIERDLVSIERGCCNQSMLTTTILMYFKLNS